MFSDGYSDQFGGEKGKKLMSRSFQKTLLDNHSKAMTEQKKILEKGFSDWRGEHEQIDDVCVMGIRILEKQGQILYES